MRNRFTGAMVAATIAAAAAVISLAVMPVSGQAPAGQRAGGAAPAAAAQAKPQPRLARIGKAPNINGIYQAINTANWNIEDHSAAATPLSTAIFLPVFSLIFSPTRLTPTSMTQEPGLIHSGFTSPGTPAATISISARWQWAFRSFVPVCTTVTVELAPGPF